MLNLDEHPQLQRMIRVVTYTATHAIIVAVQILCLTLLHRFMIFMSIDGVKFFGLVALSDVIDAMELVLLSTFLLASTIEGYRIFNEKKPGDENEP